MSNCHIVGNHTSWLIFPAPLSPGAPSNFTSPFFAFCAHFCYAVCQVAWVQSSILWLCLYILKIKRIKRYQIKGIGNPLLILIILTKKRKDKKEKRNDQTGTQAMCQVVHVALAFTFQLYISPFHLYTISKLFAFLTNYPSPIPHLTVVYRSRLVLPQRLRRTGRKKVYLPNLKRHIYVF